jgi:DNA polymerase III delta prime subunit
MELTDLHATLLAKVFEKVLGQPLKGTMAFVRCLAPEVVELLAARQTFRPSGWEVWRVADADDAATRTLTADCAVEKRESKESPLLLLVDTSLAGAGMDGIYSAACEVEEGRLFKEAISKASREVTRTHSREVRLFAEGAIKKARGHGHRFSISPWTEFDFLARIAAEKRHPGELLHLLGLWPIAGTPELRNGDSLALSRIFVDRLLGAAVGSWTPGQRIESLKLLDPAERQLQELERIVRSAAMKPLSDAMVEIGNKSDIWIGPLRTEGASEQAICRIELVPWRTKMGKLAKWSGLRDDKDSEAPAELILSPVAEKTGDFSKLEVRWKAHPENLKRGAVEYRVAIVTDLEEEIASRDVSHSGRKEEKCRFSDDDFSMLDDNAVISAKIVVKVRGNDSVEEQESEEFRIALGKPLVDPPSGGIGKKVRTFSEGVIELNDRETVSTLASSEKMSAVDSKECVLLRCPDRGKTYRVPRPSLIAEVEQDWGRQSGAIGRWRVGVRATGERPQTTVEFIPCTPSGEPISQEWERVTTVSRRMAERFAVCSGVGQIYDDHSKVVTTVVKEYLLAWTALLEKGEPSLALANTVEVQSLSGRTIGLIVLPSHPLRVAWHVAYDNLVLHARFGENEPAKKIRAEFAALDGAMFPAFLPGIDGKGTFVFADTLGFHCVGMVSDQDREPKAAIAILARALGNGDTADSAPTVGRQSAQVLGDEMLRYVECHDKPHLLHVHALRAGDGLTIARSLGRVQQQYRSPVQEEGDEAEGESQLAFVLELYPSQEQRAIAGRFIADAQKKRRTGAGVVAEDDRWMLQSLSLPGRNNLPRLRWARKDGRPPETAAHLALAFDTFESQVVPDNQNRDGSTKPYFAFGLISSFDREYSSLPAPVWQSFVLDPTVGEKHPSDRIHTERLVRLQHAVQRCAARSCGESGRSLILRTEISPEKARSLRDLHRLCDWVITLDRNAGVEYFDSPRDNREIYDAYVIDCVPEREDLGCLQLITSTSNLEEVRNLLDDALTQMALSCSRRNAEFLMEHLKAISGRLAIRLTGRTAPTSEVIALALSHANCAEAQDSDGCWASLHNGFLIPVDDVRDLLPPLHSDDAPNNEDKGTREEENGTRPDLIYVSISPRKGLTFRFIEVKYRRHLRIAKSPGVLKDVRQQVEILHRRWNDWYSNEGSCSSFRAIRRAKLARVLRFYADKATRHGLSNDQYKLLIDEINRMLEKGAEYSLEKAGNADRGWIFCPEYAGSEPLEISPDDWGTRIFLFGPHSLPDASSCQRADDPISYSTPSPEAPPTDTLFHEATASVGGSYRPDSGTNLADESPTDMKTHSKVEPPAPDAAMQQSAPSVCLGQDVFTSDEVRWPLTVEGNPHLLVAGLPGMGKTTCLLNLCQQMLDAGIRPIVFSYHQDIDQRLESIVGAIRYLDCDGLGFNPLEVINRQSRVGYLDVAGALRDIFLAIFPDLGDIQCEHIRSAIKESFSEKGWGDENADMERLQEPTFSRFIEILRATPKQDRGHRTLLGRLNELADYGFFKLAESSGSLWEGDKPIVIRIHRTQNDNLQKAFASLVFYKLYKDMFRRGPQHRITHSIIFDEAHRAARLSLIPTMAKECRKYGISLILASQEAKDFNVSLFSAIANYLVLRMTDIDAKTLVRNVASSDQERALVDKIKQMERFKALYFSEQRRKPCVIALRG